MAISNYAITTGNVDVVTATGAVTSTVITLCNYGASAEIVNIYAIPSGGSASNSTMIVFGLVIPAGKSYEYTTKQILASGDKITIKGTTGSLVTATASTIAL